MNYQVYPVPDPLKKYVRYFWSIDFNDPVYNPKIIKILADRYPRLIFQNLDGRKPIITADGENLPELFLSGIMTSDTAYTVTSQYSHFGVSFYSHALKAMFRIDANELTDVNPDLIHFCPKDLKQKLADAPDHQAKRNILAAFLITRLPDSRKKVFSINDFIIADDIPENWNTSYLQTRFGMSERQLERQFKSKIGVSPKTFLRITRFEKALDIIKSPTFSSLTEVAYQLNYSDQSHFIREFKSFSGYTPQQFLDKQKFGEESASFLLDAIV
ncbi:MAG: helix-turn-helix domain-containing protein [Dyadobacter sp.]|uniref:helix-turn-helix domain-containing protein n=1 Tax=Dyadobacter sp. TaxID=1914288 RepID=UPI0032655623